jgi:hypothetical protein
LTIKRIKCLGDRVSFFECFQRLKIFIKFCFFIFLNLKSFQPLHELICRNFYWMQISLINESKWPLSDNYLIFMSHIWNYKFFPSAHYRYHNLMWMQVLFDYHQIVLTKMVMALDIEKALFSRERDNLRETSNVVFTSSLTHGKLL